MAQKVTVNNLYAEIQKEFKEYNGQTRESVEKAVKETAKETIAEIKEKAPVRYGKYQENWTSKLEKSYNATTAKIYNKKKGQISHLLEKGHARRGGGRSVPGIPHIAPAEEKIEERLVENIRKGQK